MINPGIIVVDQVLYFQGRNAISDIEKVSKDPHKANEKLLLRILKDNESTEYSNKKTLCNGIRFQSHICRATGRVYFCIRICQPSVCCVVFHLFSLWLRAIIPHSFNYRPRIAAWKASIFACSVFSIFQSQVWFCIQ